MASAIGERQMLPKQMKRIFFTKSDEFVRVLVGEDNFGDESLGFLKVHEGV